MKTKKTDLKRLESLDALRGFDLFFLVALGPFMEALAWTTQASWLQDFMWVFRHVEWEGFSPWDLIMPSSAQAGGAALDIRYDVSG